MGKSEETYDQKCYLYVFHLHYYITIASMEQIVILHKYGMSCTIKQLKFQIFKMFLQKSENRNNLF